MPKMYGSYGYGSYGLPDSQKERLQTLENLLVDAATGGRQDTGIYSQLRSEFMQDDKIRDLLPTFVRTCRTVTAFWQHIKDEAATYAERRAIISKAFTPAFDYLEGRSSAPSDEGASDTLQSFDTEGVHALWAKALARRESDPEGAITVARTLLETVCDRILNELAIPHSDKDDLPKLYGLVAKELNLAPHQHANDALKAILGGAVTVVNGIGTLRNKFSDAHVIKSPLPVRPSPRHASLAVNTAGAVATFLVETYQARRTS